MGGEQITSDLLLHELIVGEILVEGADHVVAITPGFLLLEIKFMAAGFRETDEIEPVPGPSLSIVRRGQQAVDNLLIRLRRFVGQESCDLFRRRRKAGEVERHPAQ